MATIETRLAEDGTKTFRVKVRIKGQRPQQASFARLTDAKRWAQSTEAVSYTHLTLPTIYSV